MSDRTPDTNSLATIRTADGTSLDALSRRSPLLVVFLRHFG